MQSLFTYSLIAAAVILSGCNGASSNGGAGSKSPQSLPIVPSPAPAPALSQYLLGDGFNFIAAGPTLLPADPSTVLPPVTHELVITGYNDNAVSGIPINFSGTQGGLRTRIFAGLTETQAVYNSTTRSFNSSIFGPPIWSGIAQTSLNLSNDTFWSWYDHPVPEYVTFFKPYGGSANSDGSITLTGANNGGTDTQYSMGVVENLAGQKIASVLQLDRSKFPLNNANATFSAGASRFVLSASSLQPYYGLYTALGSQSVATTDDAVKFLLQSPSFLSWWPSAKACGVAFNGLAGDLSQGSVSYIYIPDNPSGKPTGAGTAALLGVGTWSVVNEHGHDMIELSNVPAACAPNIPGAVPLVALYSTPSQPGNVFGGIKVPPGANIGPVILPGGYAYNNEATADLMAQLRNGQ